MNRSMYPTLVRRGLLCLLCAALILSAPMAWADQGAEESAAQALRDFTVPGDDAQPEYDYTTADGAAVRQKFNNILDMYEAMCRTMKMSDELATLAESRVYLNVLSDDHLSALAPALPELTRWGATATALTAQLRQAEERGDMYGADAASDTLPMVDYWEPKFPCVFGPLSTEAMVVALEVMQAANLVWGVLEHVCGVTIAGFNVEYVCIFVGAPVFFVAQAVYENMKFCADDQVESHITTTYDRTAHLHDDLSDVQGAIDSMMTIIEKMLEDQSRDLHMQIEINLAGHGVHPHAIAMFQLPAILGGYLDTARTIVMTTIETMRTHGESVNQAELKLAMGDEQYAMGHYKDAYWRYSQAYRYATRAHSCVTGENNDGLLADD